MADLHVSRCRTSSVAKWKILFDSINVSGSENGRFPQRSAPLGILPLEQMPLAGAAEQDLAGSRNLEAFGDRLFCFNAFGASHKFCFV